MRPSSATQVLKGAAGRRCCWKPPSGSCSVRGNPGGQRRGRGPQKAWTAHPPASSVNCLLGRKPKNGARTPPLQASCQRTGPGCQDSRRGELGGRCQVGGGGEATGVGGGLWSLEGAPSRHEGGPEPCGQVLGSGQHSAHLDSGRSWHWGLGTAQPTPTAPSGWHFDTKVFAKLFQKHKREHGVGHEADASRQEALVKG